MPPTYILSAFAQHVATAAVTALWQGTIVAIGVAICLRLVPRISAEHRFTLWAAAFATIVSLPVLALLADFSAAANFGSTASLTSQAPHPLLIQPLISVDARWSVAIAALWAAVALVRACGLAVHSLRLRKIWKQAIPVELDSRLNALLASTPAAMKRWPIEVCTTTTLQRPCVIGFFKPRILIPDWLLPRLTAGELEQIVLHEAEHLRRRDDWTNLFQKLCLVVFPLNPALVWIERRMCREREMACDDGVIAITRAPRAYAACLASLAERGLERRAEALSLGAWHRRPELVHRVHSILRRSHALGPQGSRVLLGALGCALVAGSVALARCPQLVAFVAVPRADAAAHAGAKPVQGASARLINTAYINTAFIDRKPSGADRSSSSVRVANRICNSSADSVRKYEQARVAAERGVVEREVAQFDKAPRYQASAHSPRSVFLKADTPNAQSAPAQEQQWFVLATWQQVDAPDQNSGLTADYEIATTETASGGPKATGATAASPEVTARTTAQPAHQITVTRLILKIYSASSVSNQPASLPMRGGWFVLQL